MDFMPESPSRDRTHQIITGKRIDHRPFGTLETTSSSYSTGQISLDEEEQDMANCLIMLSHSVRPNQTETIATKCSSDNYECKTCNRAFQSFQALGGHRASHKKPKLNVQDNYNSSVEDKHPKRVVEYEQNKGSTHNRKVHECSICGSEFLSGQALGGHMRRHRTVMPSTTEKTSLLSLDLNLPAPDVVDDVLSNYQFSSSSSQQPLVFSATSLVDCHY